MKSTIRKFVPKSLLGGYHRAFVFLSALYYGFPSDKMIVIGVTGTKGKTSTVNFIADILESAGNKVAVLSTAVIRFPGESKINTSKMTMPGRAALQKFLYSAQRAGCKYVVIETSSEGIAQHRTTAITYDVAVFTNLTPEHIESHGSFEKYKASKQKLFKRLAKSKHKPNVPKVSVVNLDDEHAPDFSRFPANMHFGYTLQEKNQDKMQIVHASNVQGSVSSLQFDVEYNGMRDSVFVPIPGTFHVGNILAAVSVALSQQIPWNEVKAALKKLKPVPGRMQFVEVGQPFKVIVDYAHEPKSLEAILKEARTLAKGNRVIVLTGSQGGGRDIAKREKIGATAKKFADYIVISNEDTYDDDPETIMNGVANGIEKEGGIMTRDYVKISDRRSGIAQALREAKAGDVVVIAGKGSETVMAVENNKKIPWSDQEVIREILSKGL